MRSASAPARYWRMDTTNGTIHFVNVAVGGGAPQPLPYTLQRYGGFVQGAFKF